VGSLYVYYVSYAVQQEGRFGFGAKPVELPWPLNSEENVVMMRRALEMEVQRESGEECLVTPIAWMMITAQAGAAVEAPAAGGTPRKKRARTSPGR